MIKRIFSLLLILFLLLNATSCANALTSNSTDDFQSSNTLNSTQSVTELQESVKPTESESAKCTEGQNNETDKDFETDLPVFEDDEQKEDSNTKEESEPITPTPTPTPTPDHSHDDNDDGSSTAEIIGIIAGGAAVSGLGTFAYVWFAIKKKSFADLIAAIFKK